MLKTAGLGLSIDLIAAVGFAQNGTPRAKATVAINPAAGYCPIHKTSAIHFPFPAMTYIPGAFEALPNRSLLPMTKNGASG